MDNESTAPVQIGEILAGKYRIERVLGMGGMGVVVEALHVELDQRVALKFMLPAAAANQAAVERFAREARASAKLRSDNIVHVTDVGTLESGAPFMVMEYLEGEDLGQMLKAGGPFSVGDAIDYVLQGCAGLAEAHAAGIIHRDLKPANLFLARREDTASVVKIVDFGISKVRVDGVAQKLTSTSDLMGSPLYMSPEQLASSRDVDARTDIWSLGIILYELLAGAPPFDGDTLPQVCAAVLVAHPPPILEKRPDLPDGLVAIVAKCLEKRADDRYADVRALADALAEFAPPHSSATLERISRLAPGASRAPAERSPTPSERPRLAIVDEPHRETASPWTPADGTAPLPKTSKRTWVVVAIACAAIGVGGAFALAPRRAAPVRPLAQTEIAAPTSELTAAPVSPPIASASAVAMPIVSPPATIPQAAHTPTVAKRAPRVAPSSAAPPAPSPSASDAPSPPPAPSSTASSAPSASAAPSPSAAPAPVPSATPKPASPYEE